MTLLAHLGAAPEDETELRKLMRRALGVAEEGGGALALDERDQLVLHAPEVKDSAGIAAFCDAAVAWRAALDGMPRGAASAAPFLIRP